MANSSERFFASFSLFALAIGTLSMLNFHLNICSENQAFLAPNHVMHEFNHMGDGDIEGFRTDPNPQMNSTKVAWLMSYPNSGTSFTMKLVGESSNRSTASNYGLECDFDSNGENVPLYRSSPNGPYIAKPFKPLPDNYILTKTHCGSRCVDCGPSKFLETKESFMDMCGKGAHVSSNNLTKVHVKYDPALAQRAIHLVRNPFNNIVSNFHLERHNKARKGSYYWLEKYPSTSDGFRKWCRHIDKKYTREEANIRLIPDSVTNLFDGIPCHNAFYTFVQVRTNVIICIVRNSKTCL